MLESEKYKIGVFGSAGGVFMENHMQPAKEIGEEIARYDGILCTGACHGLPNEAALGASMVNGQVIGFSPAVNFEEHVEKYKLPSSPYLLIYTGAGLKGRNIICTRTCDAGIFISGRWGTLNEFTLMVDEGKNKVIGLLKGSGGFVDEVIIPALESTDKSTEAQIVIESDPVVLVESVFCALDEIKQKGAII